MGIYRVLVYKSLNTITRDMWGYVEFRFIGSEYLNKTV